ncbi:MULTISPECIES: PhzF family phenazine biosynthesis protein [Methylobacterium]|uniref:PhzF family phenazine biosynthesis isomerase n=1 Tax=Methylobacterium longum TaxID=767694 RepID=A0ABT8AMA7_9HYPH|nr:MULTISPECIES: PhzF family phenazine biosynthesis isomerase [Methylobacterium]MCJ2101535.1 PhzF family phenazine biosynthesis isomerase [Methylobacterium sp. E-046]MDN3570760.1 PhzF family phenazine biosynthesis isomerase [Methylobacterium longum]GJE09903.1 putative isomerase YddE [Methylobacterium longum]
MPPVTLVDVFTHQGRGGNPCPVVSRADGLDAESMRAVAAQYGHESGFALPAGDGAHDLRFRFFVPNHEMEMCAHAAIGTLWVLAREGRLPASPVRIATASGSVTGFVAARGKGLWSVSITQPAGGLRLLDAGQDEAVLAALGIGPEMLAERPIRNAVTSRVKTLVPMRDAAALNALTPDPNAVEAVCTGIGSTGFYPYAVLDEPDRAFEARQFPRASGYPEDAATGIAAAALAFGLLEDRLVTAEDRPIRILQGRAMGRLSEIRVRLGFADGHPIGCLLEGDVALGTVDA